MSSKDAPYKDFDSFEELFSQARERLDYSVEGAKNEYTEKIVARMHRLGISKSEFADRLNAERSFVTRLLSGNNNFTLETMVRIARSLDCRFRSHLEPEECNTYWVDVSKGEIPNSAPDLKSASSGDFKHTRPAKPTQPLESNEPLPAVA